MGCRKIILGSISLLVQYVNVMVFVIIFRLGEIL